MTQLRVTHLTRMEPGFICVAGLDGGTHVRPVLERGRIPRSMLTSAGGVFSLGAMVDLGATTARPAPPEIEDHVFEPRQARQIDEFGGGARPFAEALYRVAQPALQRIFGDALEVLGVHPTGAVPEGSGIRSLGVLDLDGSAELMMTESAGRWDLRLRFTDLYLGDIEGRVTDLRLWDSGQRTPRRDRVDRLNGKLDSPLLCVGLSRAFQPTGYSRRYHWLQVNSICPADNPLWARE